MTGRTLATMSVAAVLVVAGCTEGTPTDDLSVGSAADLYPSERIADWVSYADHVASFAVLDERELPMGEHERTLGEGMVDREVTVRIDRTLWSSDSARVPELPAEFTLLTWGWTLKENQKTRFAARGGPRLEVGQRYLAAWIHNPDYGWEPQTSSTILQIDDAGLATRDRLHGDSPHKEAINTFAGKSPEAISEILASTKPDPVPAQYLHLRPHQRYKLVVLETEMPDRPGYLKAANVEGNIYTHGSVGYVREGDWTALVAAGDSATEIPMFDQDGEQVSTVTLDDLVPGPSGLAPAPER